MINLNSLLKKAALTPKEIALLYYFRIDDIVDKYDGDFLSSVKSTEGYDDFTFLEIQEIVNSPDQKAAIDAWRNVIAFVLAVDITAQKYYYQFVSAIHRRHLFKNVEEQIAYIRKAFYKFLENIYLAMVLNKVFNDLLNLQSPDLLFDIRHIEKESPDFCLLLRHEYVNKKGEIIKNIGARIEEIIASVREDEIISPQFIKSAIEAVDQEIRVSFHIS